MTDVAIDQQTWDAVDDYVNTRVVGEDAALAAALRASHAAGLPAINVSPPQGKFLHLLARAIGARRILEIGTLGGYSSIWLARALPADGTLVTLEANPKHAEVARANLDAARLGAVAEVVLGPALDTLSRLDADGVEPFDLTFIDADKVGTTDYFLWAVDHTRPGGLVVVDNVVRNGALADPDTDDANVAAMQRFVEVAAAEPRADVTVVQTVGSKGYDGFALAVVS